MTQTTHQRECPHPILPNIWMWSVFSEEKHLYFNGYAVVAPDGVVVIDPPSATEVVLEALSRLGTLRMVLVSNRDHERESDRFRRFFQIPVAAHVLDAPLLTVPPEETFVSKDVLPGGLHALHLLHQKSPGETAFYSPTHGFMFLGDALIGKPAGQLSMLPAEKFTDRQQAFDHLKTLLQEPSPYEALLLGDGEPILAHGHEALLMFLGQTEP